MMDENNRNFILALVLSVMVIFTWQAFFMPSEEELARQRGQQTTQQSQPGQQPAPSAGAPQPSVGAPTVPGATAPASPAVTVVKSRQAALAESPRVAIQTPSLQGSIALKGARIDDLVLTKFKETTKPDSELVKLFSPSGSPEPFYAEHGWAVAGAAAKVPTPETVWTAETQGPLTPESPVVLRYDNGEGLIFRRTVSIDRDYMFTIAEEVENKSGKPVVLHPFGLISRHGEPHTAGFYILHEGLIGYMGEDGLKERKYADVLKAGKESFKGTSGWFGFTDKYWASALIPDQKTAYDTNFQGWTTGNRHDFQADYLLGAVTVDSGAKQTYLIDNYEDKLGIKKFELMIDWGWFHFITKPLFYALDFFYGLVGNFGIAILIVTVLIKLAFFPLANKSYESMSKMKKLQPEVERLRERYKDDRMKQQQGMMELYRKEKVNPMSGCLPILIQIPVFFALYKVLYITIEARHAPFFGWIHDLSAPDPTTIFNLFGLIPWDPPQMLMLGIWPIIMGITMFVQMKLNPAPADPVQQKIFTWMPVLFTFLLAAFPAGLVIYWTWNNSLSILQQWVIMRRQGVEVNLLENIGFRKG